MNEHADLSSDPEGTDPAGIGELALTDVEREFLFLGTLHWIGPAYPTEAFAQAIGFEGSEHLDAEAVRLGDAIRRQVPLSLRDWASAILLTELAFASVRFGAAADWGIVTGIPDGESLATLRSIQAKALDADVWRDPEPPWEFSWESD